MQIVLKFVSLNPLEPSRSAQGCSGMAWQIQQQKHTHPPHSAHISARFVSREMRNKYLVAYTVVLSKPDRDQRILTSQFFTSKYKSTTFKFVPHPWSICSTVLLPLTFNIAHLVSFLCVCVCVGVCVCVCVWEQHNNNNNNNNLLQLGFHPVEVVILYVHKIWNWLVLN